MGVTDTAAHTLQQVATMWKCKGLLLLLFSSTLLLFLPQPTNSAPIPNPEPLSPGIIIGAKAGALLVLKAILLSQYLSGEKAEPESDYGAPSSSYGAPSSSYGAPSSSYGAPSYEPVPSYKPTSSQG